MNHLALEKQPTSLNELPFAVRFYQLSMQLSIFCILLAFRSHASPMDATSSISRKDSDFGSFSDLSPETAEPMSPSLDYKDSDAVKQMEKDLQPKTARDNSLGDLAMSLKVNKILEITFSANPVNESNIGHVSQ
jgi:hypothetical protein